MTRPRIHVVATLRNEGPYLVEWIAHYRSIGVTDFTLFSNDCTDGTNLMLDRLDAIGIVRHFDNPISGRMDPQRRAYSRAGKMREIRTADWVLVIDADEFVHVRVGDGTLPALIDACGPADAISLGWQLMGSGGATTWIDAPVTERFVRAGRVVPPENGMVPGFKTLFRPGMFDYFGVHRPKFDIKKRTAVPTVRWVNGSGKDMGQKIARGGWRFRPGTAGYAHAHVNHYAVKSREEFVLKRLRGSANTKDDSRLDQSYWDTFDLNSEAPDPIPTVAMRAEAAGLLSDGDLAALRRASVATAQRTLATRLDDDETREFLSSGRPAASRAPLETLDRASVTDAAAKDRPMRVVAIAEMPENAPYLLEWISWHHLIGVSRFVIVSHASTDGTVEMLDRLSDLDLVDHIRSAHLPRGPDGTPVFPSLDHPSLRAADWIVPLGHDEFIECAVGDGSVRACIEACDPENVAAAISLVRRTMGSQGQALPSDQLLTERFCRGARIVPRASPDGFPFRTLFRTAAFDGYGAHHPTKPCSPQTLVWLNGSGCPIKASMQRVFAGGAIVSLPRKAIGTDIGSVRHFEVKSRAEFLARDLPRSASARDVQRTLDAFVLRNINTLPLDPLGGKTLRDAVQRLQEDPQLASRVVGAKAALQARIAELRRTPKIRRFIDTGRTDAPRPRSPGRLLCVATHHKTGTMWMRYALRQISDEQGIPMHQMSDPSHLARIPSAGPCILVHWNGEFPRPIYTHPDARVLHVIRDPRDVLISGMRYHLHAPQARERLVRETRPEWNGLTYQSYLNHLSTDVERLQFEMENAHRTTVEEMLSWEFGRANTTELRYEDLIVDHGCVQLRAALEAADIDGLDLDGAVKAFWRQALFGGNSGVAGRDARIRRHIASGAPEQWRTQLPRAVAEIYQARFGEALRILSYADSAEWVTACDPEAPAGGKDEADYKPSRRQQTRPGTRLWTHCVSEPADV